MVMKKSEVVCVICKKNAISGGCARVITEGRSIYVHDQCMTELLVKHEYLDKNCLGQEESPREEDVLPFGGWH